MSEAKWWNEIYGREKRKELRLKTYSDSVPPTTKPTWSDRDANSRPQRWEASAWPLAPQSRLLWIDVTKYTLERTYSVLLSLNLIKWSVMVKINKRGLNVMVNVSFFFFPFSCFRDEWPTLQVGRDITCGNLSLVYSLYERQHQRLLTPVMNDFLWWWPMICRNGWSLSFPDICLKVEERCYPSTSAVVPLSCEIITFMYFLILKFRLHVQGGLPLCTCIVF